MLDLSTETLLARLRAGDEGAREPLFQALYDELHQRASAYMHRQRPGHTLQATALVNEACVKLLRGGLRANDRTHLVRMAAEAMRQILVDHARKKASLKNEAPGLRVTLDGLMADYEERSGGLLALDEALRRLARDEPELVELIELRFFGGRSMKEVSALLDVPKRTLERRWQAARLYLKEELARG